MSEIGGTGKSFKWLALLGHLLH